MASAKKQRSFKQDILKYLAETNKDLLDLSVDILVNPESLFYERHYQKRYSARQRAVQLYSFKHSKYFQRKSAKSREYVLTSYGRAFALRHKALQKQKKRWDGKYRAVGFDITEKRRRQRAFLRRELKLLGCVELHQSFWITPADILEELLCLLKLWNIEMQGDVRVFVIQKIYEDKDLKKRFGKGG